jgi:CHAT domain-containing protein
MLLEKALSLREEQRSSFAVKQRGSFLSISNARPYWSLARSYAQLYQKTKDKRFLAKSLGIDSKMRARQFGELVGLKQSDDYLQDKPPLVNGELLLNYLVTDSDIILTALSNTWAEQFIIKKSRDEIEATVNDVREAIAQQSMKKYEDAVANLSAVLITPIKGKLSQFPKLVVSLDGHLNLVPFSIVLSESNKPMITSHAVTHVPSIDYFRWMRNTKGDVPQTGNKVFVLANPQYAAKLTISKLDSYEQSIMTRSIDQYNLFAPLPETLKEAQNIELRFGGSNTFSISGSEATKKKILSSDLSQYRYLHFATHGILGDQISGINEPALVMAAADTFDGNFLRLSDLEKIKLNAELTVLSACDTGRGEYVNGEGVFGMSRGFLQAGSKSVLVSLWPVASDATVVFMDRFYGYLRSGKSKAESLRMTQMDFLKGIPISDVDRRSVKIIDKKTKRFSAGDSKNPFYWAPFVIIGE